MTRDPIRPLGADAFDDDTIAKLVRDAAGGWTMPAVRLDAPSWRERVRGPRARRIAATRGWFGRLGQAATAAVALTVVGALLAVILTRPTAGPGKSPEATSGATPGPSDIAASILPKLVLSGDMPSPAIVLVGTEGGFVANVDLATGTLGREFTAGGTGSAVQRQPDGSVLCLCVKESARVNGTATVLTVTLDRFGSDGTLVGSHSIDVFTGAPDPRDSPSPDFNYPPHAVTVAAFTADGRFGLVGWSLRDHPAWRSGIMLVDLTAGVVLSRLDLPDVSTGDANDRRVVQAPRVVGDTGGGTVVVARTVETWSSPDPQSANVVADVDVFTATIGAGTWADMTPVTGASGCGYVVQHGGGLADGGIWLTCLQDFTGNTIIRRITAAGARLDDITVRVGIGIVGDMVATSTDGSALFAWDPASAKVRRIDLASGEIRVGSGGVATSPAGPLVALGDWLAPPTSAKSLLAGAVVVSPDGTRIYAIGVTSSSSGQEITGSAGIYVFDSTTLAQIGHWAATADYVSLAISPDGRYVYVTGLPGVDAAGRQERLQGASITVFDAADGSVRLQAGELGSGMLDFPTPVLE